jgi:hypothetical protein
MAISICLGWSWGMKYALDHQCWSWLGSFAGLCFLWRIQFKAQSTVGPFSTTSSTSLGYLLSARRGTKSEINKCLCFDFVCANIKSSYGWITFDLGCGLFVRWAQCVWGMIIIAVAPGTWAFMEDGHWNPSSAWQTRALVLQRKAWLKRSYAHLVICIHIQDWISTMVTNHIMCMQCGLHEAVIMEPKPDVFIGGWAAVYLWNILRIAQSFFWALGLFLI